MKTEKRRENFGEFFIIIYRCSFSAVCDCFSSAAATDENMKNNLSITRWCMVFFMTRESEVIDQKKILIKIRGEFTWVKVEFASKIGSIKTFSFTTLLILFKFAAAFVPQSAFIRALIENSRRKKAFVGRCKEQRLMKGNQGNDKNTFGTKIYAARTSKPQLTSLKLSELWMILLCQFWACSVFFCIGSSWKSFSSSCRALEVVERKQMTIVSGLILSNYIRRCFDCSLLEPSEH